MKRYFAFTSLLLLSGMMLLTLPGVGMPSNELQGQKKKQTQAQEQKKSSESPACPRPDNDIINDIYDKLKASPQFKNQYRQINVTSENGSVKLVGWVLGGEPAKQKLIALVGSVACVKKPVDAKDLSTKRKSGCDPATEKECGNGCIPKSSTCNVR